MGKKHANCGARGGKSAKAVPPLDPMTAPSSVQRQQYAEFLRSPHLLSRIFDIAEDAIISIDQGHQIVMFNQGAEKMFGFRAHEVLGQPLDMLLPRRFAEAHRGDVSAFGQSPIAARRMGERGRIAGRRKDGTEFPGEASISKVDLEGVRIYSVILRDMTEHVAAEQKIKAALLEKEVLLKEIHHRVKNNLQVVSSLLSLQSRGVQDEATRQMFKESQNRVQSMALIHEQLYQSKSLSELDFPAYVKQLVSHLFRSHQISSSRIELKTKVDDVQLGVELAIPCGLIINELVTNALKHAFPADCGGKIEIELTQREEGLALCVRDNGVGIPEEIGLRNSETLGLRLVRSLVMQLEGKARIQRSEGTAIEITFSVNAAGKESD